METINATICSHCNKKFRNGFSDIERAREDDILDVICNSCNKEMYKNLNEDHDILKKESMAEKNMPFINTLKNKK